MLSNFVFTGILRCGHCGALMSTESAKGRRQRYHYYNCRAAQVHGDCRNRRINAHELDKFLTDAILGHVLTEKNLRTVISDLNEACGNWAKEQKRRRTVLMRQIEGIENKRETLFELLETLGKNAPNLGDLTTRLRQHNTKLVTLRRDLDQVNAEEPPRFEVKEDEIAFLAETITETIRTAENPKKIRQFFNSFVDRIVVGDSDVRIEYRPQRLAAAGVGTVPSKVKWLPGLTHICELTF